MSLFWAGAGALLVFAVLILAAPPLLARRRDGQVSARAENLRAHREHLEELERQGAAGELAEADLQPLREELEYALLLDADAATEGPAATEHPAKPGWPVALLLALAVVIGAAALYERLGAARDWQLARDIEAVGAATDRQTRERLLRGLVASLERKLQKNAAGTTEQFLLARSQMELGRYPEAARAYATLVENNPDEPRLLAEYAQARFAASGRVLGPETADILRRVVALDPHNQTALGMLGLGMFNHGNYAAAVRYWEQALAVAQDPAGRRALQAGIGRAREQMGLPPREAAATGPQVRVTVTLGESAAADLDGTAAIFVFARRVNGPRMPLAAARLAPKDLPRTVLLDDRSAMMEGMNLSSAGGEVEVLARLTRSGQPLAQSGDWESAPVRVRLDTPPQPVELQIDRRVP